MRLHICFSIHRVRPDSPLSSFLYSTAHDSSSLWWRILGVEINIPLEYEKDEDMPDWLWKFIYPGTPRK